MIGIELNYLDDDLSESVIDMFIKLFNDGYVYRDKKIVNWDPSSYNSFQ